MKNPEKYILSPYGISNYDSTDPIIERILSAREHYTNSHKFCPKCKSTKYSSTLTTFLFDINHPENYRDENRIKCECGWSGITHDLIA